MPTSYRWSIRDRGIPKVGSQRIAGGALSARRFTYMPSAGGSSFPLESQVDGPKRSADNRHLRMADRTKRFVVADADIETFLDKALLAQGLKESESERIRRLLGAAYARQAIRLRLLHAAERL